MALTMPRAQAQLRHGESLLTQPIRSPEREGGGAPQGRSPLKTRRTIYRTSPALHRKVERAGG